MAENKPIIRKVIKKGHGGGHHGGSWKVAYADFVTAMMAFFLLMWLLAMVVPEKRAGLAQYFNNFSLFETSGMPASPAGAGGPRPIIPDDIAPTNDIMPQEMTSETLRSTLEQMVETKLKDLKDQMLVDSFDGGVRVQIVYTQDHPIFQLGSTALTEDGRKMLLALTAKIKNLPNKLAIEGHTDAKGYTSEQFTNWELSVGRASAARQEMERAGLNTNRLVRVAGYAATSPLIADAPEDPRNRRISILLYDKGKAPNDASPYPDTGADKPEPSMKGVEKVLDVQHRLGSQ